MSSSYFKDPQGAILYGDMPRGGSIPAQAEIDAYLLNQARATQIATLSNTCSTLCQADFISNALGANYTYPSKFPTDQLNLDAQCTGALNNPAGMFNTMCMDSTGKWAYVAHTAAQIKVVGETNRARIEALRMNYAAKVAQVNSATTIAQIQAVI